MQTEDWNPGPPKPWTLKTLLDISKRQIIGWKDWRGRQSQRRRAVVQSRRLPLPPGSRAQAHTWTAGSVSEQASPPTSLMLPEPALLQEMAVMLDPKSWRC